VEAVNSFPSVQSERTKVTTEEVPYQTFHQEFDTVFDDFPFKGELVTNGTSRIGNTVYSISYANFVLKISRGDLVIAERRLPPVFYMHPMNSGVILRTPLDEDLILCRIVSRATTGRHYVLIVNGIGEILFEKIMKAGEDWDILPGKNGEVVIGGAQTKTTISFTT